MTFALGGFGNGLALVHDRLLLAHSVPEALHGRLFALHKTCTSGAFVIAFVAAGALISTLGVQAMFLFAGLLLVVIILIVRPHLQSAVAGTRGRRAGAPAAAGAVARHHMNAGPCGTTLSSTSSRTPTTRTSTCRSGSA